MPSGLLQKYPRTLVSLGVGLLLAVASLLDSGLVPASYDRSFGRPPALEGAPVVLVYLDEESYQAEGQNPEEPWSRSLHARLVRRLARAGARAIVFDIIFDRLGPAEADAEFEDAIRQSARVILAAGRERSSRAPSETLGTSGITPMLPLPRFRSAAAAVGLATLHTDEDFVVRRYVPGDSEQRPSLTWACATFLKLSAVNSLELAAGRGWVRYYGVPLSLPHISYHDALEPGAVSDSTFRDKIIFVGARPMTEGFRARRDEFRSPYSSWGKRELFMPAVEVHATQMLNLVRRDWLRRWPEPAEAWLLIALGLGFSVILFRLRPVPAVAAALAAEGGLIVLARWGPDAVNVWFPWLIPALVQIPGALFGSVIFQTLDWYRTRKRLEFQRRAAETRIREQAALLDKAQDAILVEDMSGQFVYSNPSAERLYGWSAEELRGGSARLQIAAPGAAQVEEARRGVLSKGEWTGELIQATRSGEKITVESRWTLIRDESGRPKSILHINTDISEKKRLEAQVLRTQRMDTVGALAGGMAHDLNNALSPILMGLQLIRKKPQDEETRQMLAVMEANTHRGADMVRQVLTFSRGRDGEREILNPGHIVREIEHIARQTLPKRVGVNAMVPPDLWPVLGNSTQLYQVLLNLCVNARDAMPQGGEITLAADNVDLSAEEAGQIPGARPGPCVMLLVSDTGQGIAAEVIPQIFAPFFTTKEAGEGTGLGLATVARIVRNHQGFVSVKSELGVGTTFEIYLPRAEAGAPVAVRTAVPEVPRGRGELILLAEDDRAVREMVANSLVEHGYRVAPAADGAEALLLLGRHETEIRLVLADFTLPAVNGATAIEAICKRRPDLPYIVMSGEVGGIEAGPGADSDLTLHKPFGLEQLLAAVARRLAGGTKR